MMMNQLVFVSMVLLVACVSALRTEGVGHAMPNISQVASIELGAAPYSSGMFLPPPPFASGDMFYSVTETGNPPGLTLAAVNVTKGKRKYILGWTQAQLGSSIPQLTATASGYLVVMLNPVDGAYIYNRHGQLVHNKSDVRTFITTLGSTLYYSKQGSTMAWSLNIETGEDLPQQRWMSGNNISKYMAMVAVEGVAGATGERELGLLGRVTQYPMCNMSLYNITTSAILITFDNVGCDSKYLGSDIEYYYLVNQTGTGFGVVGPKFVILYRKQSKSFDQVVGYNFEYYSFTGPTPTMSHESISGLESSATPTLVGGGKSMTVAVSNTFNGNGALLVVDLATSNLTRQQYTTAFSFSVSNARAYSYIQTGPTTSNVTTFSYPGARFLRNTPTHMNGGASGFITMPLQEIGCEITGGVGRFEVRMVQSGAEVFTQTDLYSPPAMPGVNPLIIRHLKKFVVTNDTHLLVYKYE